VRAHADVESRPDAAESREDIEDTDADEQEATELPDREAMSLINPGSVTGYCHLGGSAVPDAEAYGVGLVDALAAVDR